MKKIFLILLFTCIYCQVWCQNISRNLIIHFTADESCVNDGIDGFIVTCTNKNNNYHQFGFGIVIEHAALVESDIQGDTYYLSIEMKINNQFVDLLIPNEYKELTIKSGVINSFGSISIIKDKNGGYSLKFNENSIAELISLVLDSYKKGLYTNSDYFSVSEIENYLKRSKIVSVWQDGLDCVTQNTTNEAEPATR